MFRRALAVVVLLFIACSGFADSLADFDAKIEKELAALDASAVPLWREANAARAAGKSAEAAKMYADVFARAPRFVHALRRQAGEELTLGNRDLAVQHARKALALDYSPENHSFLAQALISTQSPTEAEIFEAKGLAQKGAMLNPNDSYEQGVVAQVAYVAKDSLMLRTAVERLHALAPNDPQTHVMQMVLEVHEGDYAEARAALDRASALGLPKDAYDLMSADLQGATPFYANWWKPVTLTLVAWFGVFALLLVAGALLSRMAMKAARETHADGSIVGLSSGVRRAYAAVLTLCCIFYYASIPIVLLSIAGLAGVLLYATFALGHIPVKIVVIIVALAGVSIWSMLKSLFIRARDEDPGTRLDLSTEPKLRALLDDVAARIGTRPVDNVYLTPGTDVAVMERGKGRKKERCLILGVAALDGFELGPFKAVLGHEYGHFTNRDTAGGAFALAVRNSLNHTAVGLIEGGAAAWYNPAWLFVNGFNRVFLRISQGASRLQEVLADRWAVFVYGAEAFERGLRHVVERSVRFDAHVGVTLKEVVDAQKPLANLYTYTPSAQEGDLTDAIAESLNAKSSPYDSHPTPSERFELVHALPKGNRAIDPDDASPAWSVFTDPEALQHSMTAQVRENVRRAYGVEIIAPPAAAPAV